MRIRDFIYGSLPKKNKKNKKNKHQNHVTIGHRRSQSRDVSTTGGFFPIAYNRHLVSEDFQYKDTDFESRSIPYQEDGLNGNDAGFSQDYEPVPEQDRKESTTGYAEMEWTYDGNCNTVPRLRSRIKTNPWLPSPKTSPAPSGNTSPMTSSTVSNGMPDFFQDLVFPRDNAKSAGSHDEFSFHDNSEESGFCSGNCTAINCSFMSNYSNLQNDNRGNCIFHPGEESIFSPDKDSLMQNSFIPDECDDADIDNIPNKGHVSSNGDLQFNYEEEFEEQVESQYTQNIGSRDDVFSVFNSREYLDMDLAAPGSIIETNPDAFCHSEDGDIEEDEYLGEQILPKTNDDSHQYNTTLSSHNNDDILYQPSSETPQEADDYLQTLPEELHFDETEISENSDSLTPVTSPTSSVSFDLEDIEFIDADTDDEEVEVSPWLRAGSPQSTVIESARYTPTSSNGSQSIEPVSSRQEPPTGSQSTEPVPTRREPTSTQSGSQSVVGSVQSSLRDKVRQLKQDKEVVDRIVYKAREEQRLRKQELARIQKQTTLARKEILLKTLMELRQKLDQQTSRLQSAYDNIITFRYNEALQRRLSARN